MSSDLSVLELQSPGAPLSLQMEVQGIVEIADGVFGVNSPSGGQLQIEPSQWDRLCRGTRLHDRAIGTSGDVGCGAGCTIVARGDGTTRGG